MDDQRDALLETLEAEMAVLMRRGRRMIAMRAQMVHPDLVPSSYLVLSVVGERGPLRASQVAEFFDMDKGAVSRQVQHLVDLGLVVRTPDPADRRATALAATEDARERLAAVRGMRRELLRGRLDGWEHDALSSFVADLARYNTTLELSDEADD